MSSTHATPHKRKGIVATLLALAVVLIAAMMSTGTAAANPSWNSYPIIGTHDIPGSQASCSKPQGSGLPTTANCAVWMVKTFTQETYGTRGLSLREGASPGSTPYFRAVPAWAVGSQGSIDFRNPWETASGCYWNVDAANYCNITNTVYIGTNPMSSIETNGGDPRFELALIFAHETGHAAQAQPFSGGRYTLGKGGFPSKTTPEDQPDCFSGAFTKYGVDKGWFDATTARTEGGQVWYVRGGTELGVTAHNINTERQRYFELGYDEGLSACNAMFLARPIAPWTS